mmetsp:Transcript_179748/g.570082  ORF Transcript_179748/g.570082 Transcript_179748/m.570082 type:complete len:323 (+) Transcript_179748:226-1194(+)
MVGKHRCSTAAVDTGVERMLLASTSDGYRASCRGSSWSDRHRVREPPDIDVSSAVRQVLQGGLQALARDVEALGRRVGVEHRGPDLPGDAQARQRVDQSGDPERAVGDLRRRRHRTQVLQDHVHLARLALPPGPDQPQPALHQRLQSFTEGQLLVGWPLVLVPDPLQGHSQERLRTRSLGLLLHRGMPREGEPSTSQAGPRTRSLGLLLHRGMPTEGEPSTSYDLELHGISDGASAHNTDLDTSADNAPAMNADHSETILLQIHPVHQAVHAEGEPLPGEHRIQDHEGQDLEHVLIRPLHELAQRDFESLLDLFFERHDHDA